MNELEQKLHNVDTQLKGAMVKCTDEKEGLYSVFVPGAVRQHTVVKATSEEEAIAKVRTLLLSKTKHFASKQVTTEPTNTKLDITSTKHGNAPSTLKEGSE